MMPMTIEFLSPQIFDCGEPTTVELVIALPVIVGPMTATPG